MPKLKLAPDWQRHIYLNGFTGTKPVIPLSFDKLESRARRAMSPEAYAYIAGGAGIEATMRANRIAFDSWKIVPCMLRDVSIRDTSTTILTTKLPAPILLAPIGVLEMVRRDGDISVAKAAATTGVPFIFSNQASATMEACAKVMGDSPRWFQLYWSKSKPLVASFVRRAEQCGCSAIVVTLDTTLLGWRTRDLELGHLPFLEGKGMAQYTSDPVFQELLDEPDETLPIKRQVSFKSIRGLISMVNRYPGPGFIKKLSSGRPMKAVRKFVGIYSNPATTWEDLAFLRDQTNLPIILKGILAPDDASKAIQYGIDGIIVSNHGGRQVDGAIASIEALPLIADVVKGRIPVLLDSGIRSGADIFKAIALGASAVCVGRPYVYGLTLAGQAGVEELLQNLIADFELTMGLSGCKNLSEVKAHRLCRT